MQVRFIIDEFEPDKQVVDLYLPIVVEGGGTGQCGDIVGHAVTPELPYMILHDPPGDESYSSFIQDSTSCRQFSESVSNITSNMTEVEATVGVAGSVGILVTADFDISVSASVGFGASERQTTTGTYETCLETSTAINTSNAEDGIGRSADLFMGYGYRSLLGEYEIVEYDGCSINLDTTIAYARDPDYHEGFIKTEQEILESIELLILDTANTNLDSTVRNMAANKLMSGRP